MDEKDERLRMEEAIIATLNADPEFVPSPQWLGLHSPEEKISNSGLWLKIGLKGSPLTEAEFVRLLELCGQNLQLAETISLQEDKIEIEIEPEIGAEGEAEAEPNDRASRNRAHGKYDPLFQFLARQTADRIVMTHSEIEAILGSELPESARKHSAWWNPKGHSHAQAWVDAGFNVANPAESIRTKIVVFERLAQ